MITLFAVAFGIVGIGLYIALVRRMPNRAFFPMLASGVVLLGLAGIGMLRLLPVDAAENPTRVIVALMMLWVGWVGLMAMVAQLLTRQAPGSHPWPVVAGGAATLAPLLGFFFARLVA